MLQSVSLSSSMVLLYICWKVLPGSLFPGSWLLLFLKLDVTMRPQQPLAGRCAPGLLRPQDSCCVTLRPSITLTVSEHCAIKVLWPCFLLCFP